MISVEAMREMAGYEQQWLQDALKDGCANPVVIGALTAALNDILQWLYAGGTDETKWGKAILAADQAQLDFWDANHPPPKIIEVSAERFQEFARER